MLTSLMWLDVKCPALDTISNLLPTFLLCQLRNDQGILQNFSTGHKIEDMMTQYLHSMRSCFSSLIAKEKFPRS